MLVQAMARICPVWEVIPYRHSRLISGTGYQPGMPLLLRIQRPGHPAMHHHTEA